MGYIVSPEEYRSVISLSAKQRYQYSLKRIVDQEIIYSLHSNDGWVLASDDSMVEYVPVWPFPIFAESCATDEWIDTIPCEIALNDWIERWLPGMVRDERSIMVFQTTSEKGFIVTPQIMKSDILLELGHYQ